MDLLPYLLLWSSRISRVLLLFLLLALDCWHRDVIYLLRCCDSTRDRIKRPRPVRRGRQGGSYRRLSVSVSADEPVAPVSEKDHRR